MDSAGRRSEVLDRRQTLADCNTKVVLVGGVAYGPRTRASVKVTRFLGERNGGYCNEQK
ncbi:Uncharacterised protein [Mycobacteroides abscessus subsp. abscessus]|uniref:Uncharacterized protein n=1 Tax=Mycobacteroides abscessus subsp. massiliense TaxID=1962118 RepID=A0A1U5W5B9_9MYCO|nr:Uncharacterised protein [Mycobacteroides abscessus]SII21385.1 Uncharacterised protein [Mycobacteroides abscessus subsp. abscessus]SKM89329.1 Uncharacterised protein [Mycobacteroides abscessus subsp. massiliense]CPX69552.1 Uncharacterised protein [Mycobacteroides abscessus]CPZ71966.1 Uncharacterised protein [Mycobacteroides abscessus]